MKRLQKIIIVITCILGASALAAALFIGFNKAFFEKSWEINPGLASHFGTVFGGFVGTIVTGVSIFLIVYTIVSQNIETAKTGLKNRFFKMLDFHGENVRGLRIPSLDVGKSHIEEGRRVFVTYKRQLAAILEAVEEVNACERMNLGKQAIADIAYTCLYYGLDEKWIPFTTEKLKSYPNHRTLVLRLRQKFALKNGLKLGRTNQTELSAYFRNMYNAIKMVDQERNLSEKEKEDLVKVLRAQLSNPELYVLFFNLLSRFGTKWGENGYVTKYQFIKNLPKGYCGDYDPNVYFPMSYEDEGHKDYFKKVLKKGA